MAGVGGGALVLASAALLCRRCRRRSRRNLAQTNLPAAAALPVHRLEYAHEGLL